MTTKTETEIKKEIERLWVIESVFHEKTKLDKRMSSILVERIMGLKWVLGE